MIEINMNLDVNDAVQECLKNGVNTKAMEYVTNEIEKHHKEEK